MSKLLKLSETHYIIVDDSEIKEGDLCYDKEGDPGYNNIKYIVKCLRTATDSYWNKYCKKITHSTQPLEGDKFTNWFNEIKPLSLSEVEELILGYNVEKMARSYAKIHPTKDLDEEERYYNSNVKYYDAYLAGFNAHKELVKDKLFTIEQLNEAIAEAWNSAMESYSEEKKGESYTKAYKRIIQPLLPPTEWDVVFDEQGKLKLI